MKISVEDRAVRPDVRAAAVAYLQDRKLAGWDIARPRRLGSGRTMTVGVLEALPVRDESRWGELRSVVEEGTRLVEKMGAYLDARPS